MPRRNILVVHDLPNLKSGLRSTLDYIYAFERYAPENNYFYHRMYLPIPEFIRQTRWDAAIFDSTSLSFVAYRPRRWRLRVRNQWAFLRHAPTVKIGFPQDDASHGAIIDLFFSWLGMDAVYTVLPEHIGLIYPVSSRHARFFPTLAGFIDDRSIAELESLARPFDARRWEIGQRVTFHQAWGGRFSRTKGYAALAVREEARRRGVAENISVDDADIFVGDDWYRFLGDCRFVVGAEGGMSLWDPYGSIYDAVDEYCRAHPGASFDEIDDECFPGLDGRFRFPVITPRVFESALMGCGQILVEGAYGGVIEPVRHYIPLKPDFSNMSEVFEAVANRDRVREMIAATRRDLVDSPRYRYSALVAEVFEFLDSRMRPAEPAPAAAEFAKSSRSYNEQLVPLTVALGAAEENLEGEALRVWTRAMLEGQFDDPNRLDALLDSALPATAAPAHSSEAAAAGDGTALRIGGAPAARSAPRRFIARMAAGLRCETVRRRVAWAMAAIIAIATYPAAMTALAGLRWEPAGRTSWFSAPFALSLFVGWALLPRRFRTFGAAGLRRGLSAALIWVIGGHAVWLLPQFFLGTTAPPDRGLVVATMTAQAGLAMAAVFALRFISDRRWRYWCFATGISLLLSLLAVPEAARPLPLLAPPHLALLMFGVLAMMSFAALVIRRGLVIESPLRYAFGVVAATLAAETTWILGLFAAGMLGLVPRWLPPATGTIEIALGLLLPVAFDVARGRIPRASLLYAPDALDDPRTRIEVIREGRPGKGTLWFLSQGLTLEDPRLIRLLSALHEADWRVVICGSTDAAHLPEGFACIRFPLLHGLRRELCWVLRTARVAALLLMAIGRPNRLKGWAAAVYFWCRPEELHLYRSLRWLAETRPDLAPDLVLADGGLRGELGAAFARRCGAKLAVDFRESVAESLPHDAQWAFGGYSYIPFVEGRSVERADLVTVPSNALGEQMQAERKLSRPALTVRALSLEPPQPFRPTGARIKVLYQGNLWQPQQLHVAIRSMPLWRAEFDLVLRGDGDPAYIADLRRLASRLGLEDRISIEPAAPPSEMLARAAAADIGYFSYADTPVRSDGAVPQKLFDYLSAGLALCVIGLGETGSLLRRYDVGKLIPHHSPEAIAETLNSFTREQIDDCRRRSRAAVEELDWRSERLGAVATFGGISGVDAAGQSVLAANLAAGFAAPGAQSIAQG